VEDRHRTTKRQNYGKVKAEFYIDAELYENFRKAVILRYEGYYHGAYSRAIEEAIRLWLGGTTPDYEEKVISNKTANSKVVEVFNQVKQYLLQVRYMDLPPGSKVPLTHLQEAIMAVRGVHERTVRRWLRAFHEVGLAKPVGPSVWQLLE
jgi:hypothetical protein